MQHEERTPTPIEDTNEPIDDFWYFVGSALGFICWIWFISWFMGESV